VIIDPEVVAALPQNPALPDDVKGQRRFVRRLNLARPPAPEDESFSREDRLVPGLDGIPDERIRIYHPKSVAGELAAIVFFHSGGVATVEQLVHVGARSAKQ